MTTDGSFYKALTAYEPALLQSSIPTLCSVYHCEDVEAKAEREDWRRVVCHAEDLLHREFSRQRYIFGEQLTLISDTVRTAPNGQQAGWVKQMSDHAFAYFVERLDILRKERPATARDR